MTVFNDDTRDGSLGPNSTGCPSWQFYLCTYRTIHTSLIASFWALGGNPSAHTLPQKGPGQPDNLHIQDLVPTTESCYDWIFRTVVDRKWTGSGWRKVDRSDQFWSYLQDHVNEHEHMNKLRWRRLQVMWVLFRGQIRLSVRVQHSGHLSRRQKCLQNSDINK